MKSPVFVGPLTSGVYYLPIPQAPALALSIAVRTAGDPASLAPTLRRVIASLDPGLPVFDVKTMEDVEADSLLTRRWPMLVTTAFSAVALVLTAVGLYGVLVYLVSQRSKEIGIRMALGGTPGAILRLIGGEAVRLMGAGLAGGAVAFMGLRRLLESQLYGVQSGDPRVLAVATLVLGLVAAAACALPASRAARLDPAKVLDRG
jgi:ABC-type antimicrobial peptide transport system permease subunit